MPDCDVIVIGSGPAGAHAAQTLVEHGANVVVLDGGAMPPAGLEATPDIPFSEVRKKDPHQFRWFLGDDLSGIPVSGLTGGLGGGQVSGNRSYVVAHAEALLPLELRNCQVIQSLAKGGLGASWGAACAIPDADELLAMRLNATELEQHFDAVMRRIGVSGNGSHPALQPALTPDHHAAAALRAYEARRAWFDTRKIAVAQPLSAVLTQDLGNRRATVYNDMDYWTDPRKSVYRPQYTIEDIERAPNCRYVGDRVVNRIEEHDDEVVVYAHGRSSVTTLETYSAKSVVVAAGAVNSARILLRSLSLYDTPVPFVGKPHVFSACMDMRSIGKAGPDRRASMCQLVVLDGERRQGIEAGCAQLYSYRSLQLFRLMSAMPLPAPEALAALSLLSPALVIADIRFPAFPSRDNTLTLLRNGSVRIAMNVSREERDVRNRSWKRLRSALGKLGIPALKNMLLPEASSSHYAGTVPQSDDDRIPLTTDARGKVRRMRRTWVADAAVFPCLPAKPHTLTIMANARRIALEALRTLD